MEWKWSKGEIYEKSKRNINNQNNLKNNNEINELECLKEQEKTAYSSSLNYDENTWDILNQEVALNGFKISNKREDLDLKIADRDLVQQIGYNPFLSDTNYVDDILIRDKFLKPINTTEGRMKINEN
jgi:hypothetical protein